MGFYARPSWRLARQVTSDVFVVGWGIAWWLVSRAIDGIIRALAVPARAIADGAGSVSRSLGDAAGSAGDIPIAGDKLRQPLDAAAGQLDQIVRSAREQAAAIDQTATWTGWLVFLIPVLIMAALWLPARIRFFLQQRAAQRFIDDAADLDLFALRAMATQPMSQLARVSPDPVREWREGNSEVIGQLAALELRRAGLSDRAIRRRQIQR